MVKELTKLIAVASGNEPPDLVLKGGQVANLFSGEFIESDVAVYNGRIAGIGQYDGPEVYDASGTIICPGFIDGHFHLESTMLSPQELAKAVIPHGTTAIIVDPHEIANVMGKKGIRFLLDASEGLPVDIFFMLPSCVPATHLETSGSRLNARDLLVFRNEPRVLGLAEIMNYPGVVNGDVDVLEKIAAFSGFVIDGHAPLLSGKMLNAYIAAGIRSDHECTEFEESREKLRLGMHIMIREGTLAKNMRMLLPLVTPLTVRRCSFVTDDLHPSDLLDYGHLDHLLNQALETGLDPIFALMMVTCNTADYFGLEGRGAIAPGYRADMTILSSPPPISGISRFTKPFPRQKAQKMAPDLPKPVHVQSVVKDGRIIFDKGKLLMDSAGVTVNDDYTAMHVRPWEPEALAIPWEGRDIRVIDLIPGQLLTREVILETNPREGLLMSDSGRDILKIIVMERHHGTGNFGRGFVRGFGLKRGAIATSVAHDSHNILSVGVHDRDIHAALQAVISMEGGLAVVLDGEVTARLPLPIGGLMSDASLPVVAERWKELRRAFMMLGRLPEEPFMTLSFLALPVIPELKITDRGLVDVRKLRHVPLFIGGD